MRILCMHGKGANAQIFKAETAVLRSQLGLYHSCDFIDGFRRKKSSSIEPTFDWLTNSHPESIRDALEALREHIVVNGPYDAILAFSQGATLAATYALYRSTTPISEKHMSGPKFMVLLSPGAILNWTQADGTPVDDADDKLGALRPVSYDCWNCLTPASAAVPVIDMPMVVISGMQDPEALYTEFLIDACEPPVTRCYMHGGRQEVPDDADDVGEIVACIERLMLVIGLGHAVV